MSHTFQRLSLYLSSESLQVPPYSQRFQKLIRVGIPSVIISPQDLSKGGCVVLETFVIATKHSRAEKVTVEAPLCGPDRDAHEDGDEPGEVDRHDGRLYGQRQKVHRVFLKRMEHALQWSATGRPRATREGRKSAWIFSFAVPTPGPVALSNPTMNTNSES